MQILTTNKEKKVLARFIATAVFFAGGLFSQAGLAMTQISDKQLSEITGQALLVTDYIPPEDPNGSGPRDFHYYRMGVDAEVDLNLNIDKLQLGCGGYNEAILANACDIDIDYLGLMGLNAAGDGPGDPATSDFRLTRPYFEMAFKENSDGTRDVVGFKFGAQKAYGFMNIGRYYENNGDPNLENGGSCGRDAQGAPTLGCHSGINTLSGNLTMHLTGQAEGCFRIIFCINGNGPIATFDTVQEAYATRMQQVELAFDTTSFIGLKVAANIKENLRFIHGIAVNSDDFFLSFQREQIEYPSYKKDGTYAGTANAGWWMNIPSMELSGLTTDVGDVGFGALGGLEIEDTDLGQRPVSNCFGNYKFC